MIITYPMEFTPFYNKLEHKCLFVVKMRVNQLKIGDRPLCQRPKMSGHNCFCFSGVSCSKSRKLFKSQRCLSPARTEIDREVSTQRQCPELQCTSLCGKWGKNERVHPGVMFPWLPWPLQSCLTWKWMQFFIYFFSVWRWFKTRGGCWSRDEDNEMLCSFFFFFSFGIEPISDWCIVLTLPYTGF